MFTRVSQQMFQDHAKPFLSRAQFEAATIPPDVQMWTVFSPAVPNANARPCNYVRAATGPFAIQSANGVGGVPAGDSSPDHYADNITPGATSSDMTTAFSLSMNNNRVTRMRPTRYYIGGTVEVDTYNKPCVLEGAAPGATHLLFPRTGDNDQFRFFTRRWSFPHNDDVADPAPFVADEVITGQDSGVTAVVVAYAGGSMTVRDISPPGGRFTLNEVVTGSIAGRRKVRGSTSPLAVRNVELKNFSADAIAGTIATTGGWFVKFEQRPIDCLLYNLDIANAHNGFDLPAMARSRIDKLKTYGNRRGGGALKGGVVLNFTPTVTSGRWDGPIGDPQIFAKPADVVMSECDLNALNRGTDFTGFDPEPYTTLINFNAGDGFYASNCHFRGADVVTRFISSATEPMQQTMGSMIFFDCYFDENVGRHVLFQGIGEGIEVTPTGATGFARNKFRGIRFANCKFRNASNGCVVTDLTEGWIDRVMFSDCEITEMRQWAIQELKTDSGFRGLTVDNCTFQFNNRWNLTDDGGDMLLNDHGHSIQSNMHLVIGYAGFIYDPTDPLAKDGGFVPASGRRAYGVPIKLRPGPIPSVVKGNNMLQCNALVKIERQPTTICAGNPGFKQAVWGNATITNPATSVTFAHNLDEDPTVFAARHYISKTNAGLGAGQPFFTVTATDVTITVPVTPTTNAAFQWEITTEVPA